MDTGKWYSSISTDLVLQPEAYRSMVCEQADTHSDDQHPAFTACGLVSRVQSLFLFSNKEKLKLILVGSMLLIESLAEPTLTLEDFVIKEPISNLTAPCASHNSGLVAAFISLAMVMHILFSGHYERSLTTFIYHLEGAKKIMEVVPADFLCHSVELALGKFFRVVRSVKATALVEMKVSNPEQCSTYLTWLFDRLAEDRCRLARNPSANKPTKNVKSIGEVC
jgi:hypothetical protein